MWHRKLSNQLHQPVLTINSQDNNICHVLHFCFSTEYLSILLLAKPDLDAIDIHSLSQNMKIH